MARFPRCAGAQLMAAWILWAPFHVPADPPWPAPETQARSRPQANPQAVILDYYRRYPDRYIRVANEKWQYQDGTRTALHSFTLRNTAAVRYCAIEVSISYRSPTGKVLQTRTVPVRGYLEALKALEVWGLRQKNVPATSESAVITVSKATVCG